MNLSVTKLYVNECVYETTQGRLVRAEIQEHIGSHFKSSLQWPVQ
jgi:hypothetical protein